MSKDTGCGCNSCEGCSPPQVSGHPVTILRGTDARQNDGLSDADRKSGTYLVIASALFLATVAFFTSKK